MSETAILQSAKNSNCDLTKQKMTKLIKKLNLPVVEKITKNYAAFLVFENKILKLRLSHSGRKNIPGLEIYVDFLSSSLRHRFQQGLGKNQLFARAMGIKKGFSTVVDATAGLGTDSLFLAGLGLKVVAVERSPIVYSLLEDGYLRAIEDEGPENRPMTEAAKDQLEIVHSDSMEYLKSLNSQSRPDAIYLDPMFPEKKKSALSPKGMQALQAILPEADTKGDRELLEMALKVAKERVVVKRPLHAPAIESLVNHKFIGKSIRYDMYLVRR